MTNKTQPYEKLINHIKANSSKKGMLISHAEIENVLGIPYKKQCGCLNGKYSYHVKKANDKLLVLALALEPIQGFGYRILEDNKYVDAARKKYNTAIKYIEKAKEYIGNTDISTLTSQEYAEWNKVSDIITDACNYLNAIPVTKTKNTKAKTQATP